MPDSYRTALGASRILLRIFRLLNLLTGAALVACFVASFVYEPAFREFFTKQPGGGDPATLMTVLRVWMVLTPPVIAAVHVLVSRLLEMVETVRGGDPFVPENATRMTTIAWCLFGLQVYHLICGVMAAAMNAAGSNIDWSFSATGWIAVALLFVLAQVFEQGTRIRSDLEAMI